MRNFLMVAILGISVMIFSGCGSKQIGIRATVPAEVDGAMKYHRIAVSIDNDSLGISSLIEQKLVEKSYNGKPLFEIVSRENLKKILDEQSLSLSGIVNQSEKINLGQIKGVDALIVGDVHNMSVNDEYFNTKRVRCANRKCKETRTYFVRCIRRHYSTSATLKLVDVQTSKIVTSKNYIKETVREVCEDMGEGFGSRTNIFYHMLDSIANEFVSTITPHEAVFSATVVDDEPDYDMDRSDEELVERGIDALQKKRYDDAEKYFKQVLFNTGNRSFSATYNLALVNEIRGFYPEALSLYRRARVLLKNPAEHPEVDEAINRVEFLARNREKVLEQVSR